MINNYGLSDIAIKAAYFSLMTAALVLVAMLLMAGLHP
jgi:hypothetical protein